MFKQLKKLIRKSKHNNMFIIDKYYLNNTEHSLTILKISYKNENHYVSERLCLSKNSLFIVYYPNNKIYYDNFQYYSNFNLISEEDAKKIIYDYFISKK